MRKFGLVPIEFWKNRELLALPAPTFKVAIYLVAGPHSNALGCFEIPIPYIVDDLKLLRKTVVNAMAQLQAIGFLKYDPNTRYVLLLSSHFEAEGNTPLAQGSHFEGERSTPKDLKLGLRASGALRNANNLISATRELSQMPDSVPWKSELSLQLAAIKGEQQNGVLTASPMPNERQLDNGKGEGGGGINGNENGNGNAQGAKSPASPASDFSFPSFSPLPKTFSFPLKSGSSLIVDPVYLDRLEQQFPLIPVRVRLLKYHQWFIDNPRKRMGEDQTKKKLVQLLQEDTEEMKKSANKGAA
jgi:hypothetical protein